MSRDDLACLCTKGVGGEVGTRGLGSSSTETDLDDTNFSLGRSPPFRLPASVETLLLIVDKKGGGREKLTCLSS
jgi:hypothetical protein